MNEHTLTTHDPLNTHSLHRQLAKKIDRWTEGVEDYKTSLDGFFFFRREAVTEPCDCAVEPSVVFVVQGVKQLIIGEEAYRYDREHFLLNSLDLPARSQVLEASQTAPSLGFMLRLEWRIMAELITENPMLSKPQTKLSGSTALGTATQSLVEPFLRLISLLDDPQAAPSLAPLIIKEIHFRLLTSDLGPRLWQIASVGSQSYRISRAIEWLRTHYATPLKVDTLASFAQMSSTTFHHHFKLLTNMSPLQYQKWLRLNEAKRLMLNENHDASNAAFKVGYESPSQFSREFSRQFGSSPKKYIECIKQG